MNKLALSEELNKFRISASDALVQASYEILSDFLWEKLETELKDVLSQMEILLPELETYKPKFLDTLNKLHECYFTMVDLGVKNLNLEDMKEDVLNNTEPVKYLDNLGQRLRNLYQAIPSENNELLAVMYDIRDDFSTSLGNYDTLLSDTILAKNKLEILIKEVVNTRLELSRIKEIVLELEKARETGVKWEFATVDNKLVSVAYLTNIAHSIVDDEVAEIGIHGWVLTSADGKEHVIDSEDIEEVAFYILKA